MSAPILQLCPPFYPYSDSFALGHNCKIDGMGAARATDLDLGGFHRSVES
jgi:hypothetical protein